jgi:hypothetical protein
MADAPTQKADPPQDETTKPELVSDPEEDDLSDLDGMALTAETDPN